ncbi:hypothetical protein Syun_012039 [Stephania yunnanensis]|uniref:Uncharacterized protein n=1 Tax=Stephania yunnanensis TaxID=152371 RepID=A0AAP0JZG5_9MAGN
MFTIGLDTKSVKWVRDEALSQDTSSMLNGDDILAWHNVGKVLYCFIWLRWAVGFSDALELHLPIVKSDHRLYYLRCKD